MSDMPGKNASVLFVAPSAYPLGGVAVWLRYVLTGLVENGFSVHLGLLAGQFHNIEEYLAEHDIDHEKVTVVPIYSRSGTREGRVQAIATAAEQTKADLVISVNAPDVFDAVNRVKNRDNKPDSRAPKAVMTLHGLQADFFLDIKHHGEKIDAVVVTNRLTGEMVKQWSEFPSKRVLYAPYGVELPDSIDDVIATKCVNSPINSQTADVSKPLVILYAGRIEQEQKRISDLVEMVKELEQNAFPYHLLMAGAGEEADVTVKALHNTVKQGQFTYLGNLSHQQLLEQAYQKADVLVLFSDWETGPIVIWEAMSQGMAIVSSQCSGYMSEGALIDDDNALLFPVGEPKAAAEAVMRLRDSELYHRLVCQAYQLVLQRYSREKSIEDWSEAMLSVIADIPAKPAVMCRKGWQKQGRIEQFLGHVLGHKVRTLLGKSALQNSPGAEWPHSLSEASGEIQEQFLQKLHEVESL